MKYSSECGGDSPSMWTRRPVDKKENFLKCPCLLIDFILYPFRLDSWAASDMHQHSNAILALLLFLLFASDRPISAASQHSGVEEGF
jgi:hypothetical protein